MTFIVKNRSSKISPGGILTLALSARKALGMSPGQGCRVTVALSPQSVLLQRCADQAGLRVSPKGQLELVGEPRDVLIGGLMRHYWLELDDQQRAVILHPYIEKLEA